jgi:hypothetical protein
MEIVRYRGCNWWVDIFRHRIIKSDLISHVRVNVSKAKVMIRIDMTYQKDLDFWIRWYFRQQGFQFLPDICGSDFCLSQHLLQLRSHLLDPAIPTMVFHAQRFLTWSRQSIDYFHSTRSTLDHDVPLHHIMILTDKGQHHTANEREVRVLKLRAWMDTWGPMKTNNLCLTRSEICWKHSFMNSTLSERSNIISSWVSGKTNSLLCWLFRANGNLLVGTWDVINDHSDMKSHTFLEFWTGMIFSSFW